MEQLNYAIRNGETVIGSACAERQGLYCMTEKTA